MPKKHTPTIEEFKATQLAISEQKMNELLSNVMSLPPYEYEIGDVIAGHRIVDKQYKGRFYKIEVPRIYSSDSFTSQEVLVEQWVPWYELRKEPTCTESVVQNKDIIIQPLNYTVDTLLHILYSDRVEWDRPYGRGDVWMYYDQQALIDSIFRSCDIGKVILAWDTKEQCYEVVDGYQRLKALKDFYEDRFSYPVKGKLLTFSDLSLSDRHYFLNYAISVIQLRNIPEELKVKMYLTANGHFYRTLDIRERQAAESYLQSLKK